MTRPVLTYDSGRFRFSNPLPVHIANFVRDPDWRLMSAHLYETTVLKAAVALRPFSDEKAEKLFERIFQSLYRPIRLPPPLTLGHLPFLDPHQRAGVEWVLSRKRSYLAHAPGAGKTAQAVIAALLAAPAGGAAQTLVIVPPSLTINWEREIRRFSEMLAQALDWQHGTWTTVGIVPTVKNRGRQFSPFERDFVICPDSLLTRRDVQAALTARAWLTLIVDEASRFKEPTAERTLALFGGRGRQGTYPGLFQKTKHTVLLDGSPMPNRPVELWAPLYALVPNAIDCMSFQEFGFRYGGARMNDWGAWEFRHSSNEEELRARLRRDFMHVVTEAELSHPERRRSMLFMDQDARSAEHCEWERRHLSTLNLSDLSEETSKGEIAHFRAELGRRKVPWVAAYVADRLRSKPESVIVFAWHRSVCAELSEALSEFSPKLVVGGTPAVVREKAFADFQAGRARIIVGNIAAMGRGHNLQRADRVIFAEYSWSDELNRQCEKRASRRGRERERYVRCEYIVSPGSMDEPILNALFTKQRRVERVIG